MFPLYCRLLVIKNPFIFDQISNITSNQQSSAHTYDSMGRVSNDAAIFVAGAATGAVALFCLIKASSIGKATAASNETIDNSNNSSSSKVEEEVYQNYFITIIIVPFLDHSKSYLLSNVYSSTCTLNRDRVQCMSRHTIITIEHNY